jgi:hypothetical protein
MCKQLAYRAHSSQLFLEPAVSLCGVTSVRRIAMLQSIYSLLPQDFFYIRLLRLIPSADLLSPIHCKLVVYPLDGRPADAHQYEALSYAWGTSDNSRIIWVESETSPIEVQVTQNLHAALIKLRNPYFERNLWVDALCINQKDDGEKAHQVGAMAKIYGLAQRVVVWLGEEKDNSALAFQTLSVLASEIQAVKTRSLICDSKEDESTQAGIVLLGGSNRKDPPVETVSYPVTEDKTLSTKREKAVLALLDRKYFHRVWVSAA